MFMVGWQRVVLLGPASRRPLAGPAAGRRAKRPILVHLIKVVGITFVLVSALMLTVGSLDPGTIGVGAPLDPELVRRQAMAAPLDVGFIVSMLLALRVCYGLAATAVDVPFSPRLVLGLWPRQRLDHHRHPLPRPSWWAPSSPPLSTLLVLALARGVLGAQEAAAVITWTVAILVSYGAAGLAATVQAVIFRRLLALARRQTPLPAALVPS